MSWKEIHHFWFGEIREERSYFLDQTKLWFQKSDQTDQLIREKFETPLIDASQGKLDDWKESPQGFVSLIILLDQFPRNIYRNTKRAFEFDSQALSLSQEMIEKKWDQKLTVSERLFAYLPFEHSESLKDQEKSMELFRTLKDEAPEAIQKSAESLIDFAQRHYDIIHRFGRFPHRNEILGRPSAPEEIEFLKQKNSSF